MFDLHLQGSKYDYKYVILKYVERNRRLVYILLASKTSVYPFHSRMYLHFLATLLIPDISLNKTNYMCKFKSIKCEILNR